MMQYKGYIGIAELDADAGVFHGRVVNTRDTITFEGTTVAALKKAFHDSVDDYLDFCQSRGEEPDKPFSGTFVLRLSPELHKELSMRAALEGKSLNALVKDALEEKVNAGSSAKGRPGPQAGRRRKAQVH